MLNYESLIDIRKFNMAHIEILFLDLTEMLYLGVFGVVDYKSAMGSHKYN